MKLDDIITKFASQFDLSDFHIRSNQPLSLRENGTIITDPSNVISREQLETFWKDHLNKSQLQEVASKKDLDFAVVVNGQRYRANGYYTTHGPCMVLRKIVSEIPEMSKLGLPPVVEDVIKNKNGLVLVTGQTGSGKSTSLAAMIDQINRNRPENIITIEDPIEFVHPSKKSIISQREVGKDTGSFGRALKSALRQDPDVILVGEMRDLETISLALTAAETGHLVFGTLHASSAASTITRVLDVFPSEQKALAQSMLAGSIRMVLSQQLLKRKGGGRIGCFEVMIGTNAVRNIIREGKTGQIASTLQTSGQDGMITMEKYYENLLKDNLIEE